MTRPIGALAALALAVVVSLFGTSLSVGRQPTPVSTLDPAAFTAIIPPSPSTSANGAGVAIETISDFRTEPALTRDPSGAPAAPRRVVRLTAKAQPAARKPSGVGSVTAVGTSHRVRGIATWYCLPGVSTCTSGYRGGMYAAAGGEIRIGNWRGRTVKVCGNGKCIYVKLIDWCACGGSRIIDLYNDAFSRLASPSQGGISVTVSW